MATEHDGNEHAPTFIANAMREALVHDGELLAVMDEDLHAGDGTLRKFNAALRTLQLRKLQEYDTQAKVADGDYRAAKKAVKKLSMNEEKADSTGEMGKHGTLDM